ncbi:DUF4419 domain-containing protein [Myxococcus sp. Y35]|uniref:DUF4419 domain-containing protein n=1 Tax=Pseudomyxococcus flavus TaxID=3115648 RepID=UPI003CF2CB0B
MPHSVTFAVDDVKPAVLPLEEMRLEEALRGRLDDKILGASHAGALFVRPEDTHPLLSAVHLAFSGHRPLVLTPDVLWITIAQGVALHVIRNAEALRFDLVRHRGRMRLTVTRDASRGDVASEDFWPGIVAEFSAQIQGHSPAMHDLMVCDFSTTGPVERVVSQVVLMDAMREYFDYAVMCICGIPTITLEGSPDDWRKFRDKVEQLPRYGLEGWARHLKPLCDEFIRASEGKADREFWRAIYKLHHAYGRETFNGWIGKLFPFLRNHATGAYDVPNPMLEPEELGKPDGMERSVSLSSKKLPTGLSRVPVLLEVVTDQGLVKARMALSAGFMGTCQSADTLALRPVPGWVIHEDLGLDAMLRRVEDEHAAEPPMSEARWDEWRELWSGGGLPGEIQQLYAAFNGASLFGKGAEAVYRIRSTEALEVFFQMRWWNASQPGSGGPSTPAGWTRFCDVGPHGFLVYRFNARRAGPRPVYWVERPQDSHGVCVAPSLAEFLRQALNSRGQVYFKAADFSPGARVDLTE